MSEESDDEDFVIYGTPLEPLDEDAVPKKRPVTLEDQVARDEHGRRRFHGAFTGGFSAGFFNTVGSLEGWKPSQFTSSRSAKSQSHTQRPEDFMDQEDMAEHGIAPRVLRPTGDYRNTDGASRKRQLPHVSAGPIPGVPVLRTLVEPVRETVGIKLLMKMGWKPGQGIGPRLSRSEKSAARSFKTRVKVYGCAMPDQEQTRNSDSGDSDGDEIFNSEVTFAPDDLEPLVVTPKDNIFGLGYCGLDRRPVLSHVNLFETLGPSLVMEEKKKKVSIRGQAFGVGAFEAEDEDIYAKEDMSQYDFALDTPRMLAEKRKQERNSRIALPPASTDVLDGFTVSSVPVVRRSYPPPPLPPGFCPRHENKPTRFSGGAVTSTGVRLSASERAVLVNEQPQVAKDKPVTVVEVERTSTTFRPFVADPDKQVRYEQFLTLSKQGQADELKRLQPLTMTEWEQERERSEFEQAARLYRPLSAAFSDRFVSAGQPESTDPLATVERSTGVDQDMKEAARLKMFGKLTRRITEWLPHSTLCKRFNIPAPGSRSIGSSNTKKPRPKFSVFNFLDAAPFNTPMASSEDTSSTQNMEVETTKPNLEVSSNAPSTVSSTAPSTVSISAPSTSSVAQSHVEATVSRDKDLEQLVDSTNKMDLYKAIFLSSSDEESDGEKEQAEPPASDFNQPSATEVNVLRNTSPPRGIFANLDFDQLNSQKKTKTVQQKTEEANTSKNVSPCDKIVDDLEITTLDKKDQSNSLTEADSVSRLDESSVYGPVLPTNISRPPRRQSPVRRETSSDEDWVELDNESSVSRSSKKKNKKSHRKCKKHKEKKHKRKKKIK